MYIKLIRNEAKGNAITGRLVIDGTWLCDTLERKGYEILALCYRVQVTMSPKFKRLLPVVCGVPAKPTPNHYSMNVHSGHPIEQSSSPVKGREYYRQGIRFHVGTKPEHSTGCVLVPNRAIEKELTDLILKAQKEHEEIILEVCDFRAGSEYGYNTPYERELQKR